MTGQLVVDYLDQSFNCKAYLIPKFIGKIYRLNFIDPCCSISARARQVVT